MKKFPWIISIIIIASCFSCNFGTSGTWRNGNINPDIKAQIDVLNKKLFQGLLTKNVMGVKEIMSSPLIDKAGKSIDTLINSAGEAMSKSNYRILDEYYTENTTTNITNTLLSGKGDDHDYTINYLALNKDMYVSLLETINLPSNYLILVVYGKYDNDWKINIMQYGQYDVLGKTAPDYYKEALQKYNDGKYIDAVDFIIIASEIARPSNDYFKYNNEDDIKSFYSKVLQEANTKYQFPISVNTIKTSPEIFAINPQFIGQTGHEGIFPIVKYKSNINLTDTIALKVENDALQKNIGNIFKGINEDKKYIIYQAFNQIPDGKTLVKHYGFIQNVK